MKLKDVYNLPGVECDLTLGHLRHDWFPEVEAAQYNLYGGVTKTLQSDGRLKLLQLYHRDYDGDRYAAMHTISFDGKPVAVVKNSGRGGDDEKERMITDAPQFYLLCAYLNSVLDPQGESSDIVDPEKEFYVDDLLSVNGNYFGEQFGFPEEIPQPGLLVLWDFNERMKNVPKEYVLLLAENPPADLPMYVRRGGYILKFVGKVTDQQKADNPQIRFDTEPGEQFYWYTPSERPGNDAEVVRI